MVVIPDDQVADTQMTAKNGTDKFRGGHPAELSREGDDHKIVYACLPHELRPLFKVCQEAQMARIAGKDHAGMRIKGDCHCISAIFCSLPFDTPEKHPVPKVNAVKDTDGNNRIVK